MRTDNLVILLAEDDDGHASLIQRNLKRAGIANEIVRVRDGQEALDYLRCQGAFVGRPCAALLLLLDINMPRVDGVGVLTAVKADPETVKLPVIMLTTTDDPREVERCYAPGAAFTSPSRSSTRTSWTPSPGSACSSKSSKSPTRATGGAQPDPAATVLILEDDPGVAQLQRRRLERAGYAVEAVTTADAALARLRAGGVALLVLDYQLAAPEDGLALYRRAQAAGLDLPVILVTGYNDDATIVQALRAGVRDYVFKTVEYLDYLPEAVRRVLDQERTKTQLSESRSLLRAVLTAARDPIILMDEQSRVTLFNPAAEQVFRCPAADALGTTIDRFLPAAVPGLAPWMNDLYSGPHELAGRRADDNPVPLEVTCSRINAPDPALYILILRDVTDRKQAEAELKDTTRQLWQAARLAGVGNWPRPRPRTEQPRHGRPAPGGVLTKTPAEDPRRRSGDRRTGGRADGQVGEQSAPL